MRLGDGIAGLAQTRDAALLLTDMPSGETQAPFDQPPDLPRFWEAAWGALRPDGIVVAMASCLRFAAELVQSQPKAFRYDLIWHKSRAGGFLNATKRPLRAHEHVLVFWQRQGAYNPQMLVGGTPIHSNAGRGGTGANYGKAKGGQARGGSTTRHPRSVLEFSVVGTTASERRHPQQKPKDLGQWLVRTYSQPGDLVVDPFAGSGAFGDAALAEGRRFIGWDSDDRWGRVLARRGATR